MSSPLQANAADERKFKRVNEFGHHWKGGVQGDQERLTCNGKAAKAELISQSNSFGDSGLGRETDGVGDETVLVSLDFPDHIRLVVCRTVMMNNT